MSDIPAKMRALVLKEGGYAGAMTGPVLENAADWLDWAEIDVPKPGEGQALIRVLRASVNPSDVHFIKGEYGQPRVKGAPAGFEGCGIVVAGPDALMGKRVAFAADKSGAWAEYALANAATCIPLRPEISDDDGAAQIVNPLTAVAMVDLAAKAGDAFIVTAATSQLGKLMTGLARDRGLKVIATTRREEALAGLREMGATEALATTMPDFEDRAREVLSTLKPRVMLDAVCDQTSETLFTLMPRGGRWVSYGKLASESPRLTQMGQLIFMEKRIEGFWLSSWMRESSDEAKGKTIKEVQGRFVDGRWSTDISATLPLSGTLDGLAAALCKPDGKVMLVASEG